jgi:Fe2+ transport system protein B
MPRRNARGCGTCPARNSTSGLKPSTDLRSLDFVVALAGNPNTGKSTVFNALTGLRQHTGNWPGKTVVRAEGWFAHDNRRFKVVDLPGTYSLHATSLDEEIARDFILFGRPDVTVVVVDANCLERNLNLVLQVLEITDRAVICLNLIDEARRHGLEVDHRRLGRELGVPVVPTAARQGEGISQLIETISGVANQRIICKPFRSRNVPGAIDRAVTELAVQIEAAFPGLANARWVALRLLDGDERVREAVRRGELGNLRQQPHTFTTKAEAK